MELLTNYVTQRGGGGCLYARYSLLLGGRGVKNISKSRYVICKQPLFECDVTKFSKWLVNKIIFSIFHYGNSTTTVSTSMKPKRKPKGKRLTMATLHAIFSWCHRFQAVFTEKCEYCWEIFK